MKLNAAFLSLVMVAGLAATNASPKRQLEIVLREGECLISSTGGVHLEIEAKAIARGEATGTRITAPAMVRVSASSAYTLTLAGSPGFEVDLRDADSRMKPFRVSGPTIRLEGDSTHVSIAQASAIKVLD